MQYRTAAHEAIAKAFNPSRFHGYIPDADHFRTQKDAGLRFGATTISQTSLQSFQAPLIDQGQTGHCGGAGTAQIVYVAMGAAGSPLSFVPSPRSIYALARILARQDVSQGLTDSGVMPFYLLQVLSGYGIEPINAPTPDGRYDDVWGPVDIAGLPLAKPNVNDEPSLLDLETSGLKLLTGQYRVDETGAGATGLIASALTALIPAGIGIFVDSNFQNWDPSTGPIDKINLNDPDGGGHWLCCDYFYTSPTVGLVFGGPNSWSKLWPSGIAGVPGSPFWKPGHYEITGRCLQTVMSDCLLFPTKVIS
jgi:hypothetical protein